MKKRLLIALSFILLSSSITGFAEGSREIYLIRHAEKQADGSKNPHLTPKGIARAERISKMLEEKDIVSIYSSNYKRTIETSQPLATKLDLEITIYNPSNLKQFAKSVLKTQGNVLIVGHSNTTPKLSELLGGKSFGKIDELEYDRIYQLIFSSKGVKSRMLSSDSKLGRIF